MSTERFHSGNHHLGPKKNPAAEGKSVTGYASLFDTQPANGAITLRQVPDYQRYDNEFSSAISERTKGKAIQFPDLYRTKNA